MKVRLPYLSRGPEYEAIADCIDYAANKTGLQDGDVAKVMSYFLERAADNVCQGKIVPMPGFGVFAPCLSDRKGYCIPKFSPSKGFRQQCRLTAPHSVKGRERLLRYSRNHTRTNGRDRVFRAMRHFRETITKQMQAAQ